MTHGDVRGKLITLEHQLATTPLSAEERTALESDAAGLIAEHELRWLDGYDAPNGTTFTWRHGFVVGVEQPRWSKRALAALQAHDVGRFLTRLDLSQRSLGDEGVVDLVNSDALRSITSLVLASNDIGPDGAFALAGSDNLAALTRLNLHGNRIGDKGATALFTSQCLRALTHLGVGRNRLGAEGAAALGRSNALSALAVLDLQQSRLGSEGAAALAQSEHLRTLRQIDFFETSIGNEGVLALTRSRTLQLTHLNLDSNGIDDEGVDTLARAENSAHLTHLNLCSNRIGGDGVVALTRSESLDALVVLGLSANRIDDGGGLAFAHVPTSGGSLPSLELLDMTINAIGPEGTDELVVFAKRRGCRVVTDEDSDQQDLERMETDFAWDDDPELAGYATYRGPLRRRAAPAL